MNTIVDTSNAACAAEPKWFANINDTWVPAPQRVVKAQVLKSSGDLPDDMILVRDHGGTNDVHFRDDDEIDLAEGNTFSLVPRSEAKPNKPCTAAAKLSYSVNDRIEVVLNPNYTADELRVHFGISADLDLVRDSETPNDKVLECGDSAAFKLGPVYITRPVKITIVVNATQKTVNKRKLTYQEIVRLAFSGADLSKTGYTVQYSGGCPNQSEGSLSKGDCINVKEGMYFSVSAADKS